LKPPKPCKREEKEESQKEQDEEQEEEQEQEQEEGQEKKQEKQQKTKTFEKKKRNKLMITCKCCSVLPKFMRFFTKGKQRNLKTFDELEKEEEEYMTIMKSLEGTIFKVIKVLGV
jgi:plastocyanin domain-containing protein